MSIVKTCTKLAIILVFAAIASVAPHSRAAERSGQPAQVDSGAGATGQSADGEKDIGNVGEAGGGGQSSGEMKPLDNTSQQPASGPGSKPIESKGK